MVVGPSFNLMKEAGKGPEVIQLRHAEFHAGVCPQAGGCLAYFQSRKKEGTIDWVRPLPAGEADPLKSGCFPLVPFSNRIAAGRFLHHGSVISLPLNMAGCPHAIHGFGWQRPWSVVERSERQLTLSHYHEAGAWPWSYEAWEIFRMTEDGLVISLSVENLSPEPMPVGLGLHPYFPYDRHLRLKVKAAILHQVSPDGLPTGRCRSHPAIDSLTKGERLWRGLDNVFEGWDRQALVSWPNRSLEISATGPANYFVLYSPVGENYFCFEPVTHLTDALNGNGHDRKASGLRYLKTGEALFMAMSLKARTH